MACPRKQCPGQTVSVESRKNRMVKGYLCPRPREHERGDRRLPHFNSVAREGARRESTRAISEVEVRLCAPRGDTTNIDVETLASIFANEHLSSCRLSSKCGKIPVNRDVFTVNVSASTVDARALLIMSKCIGADGERERAREAARWSSRTDPR